MTPDTLARLQAPLHHLIPHGLLLCFGHLGQRWLLADLVELTVVDGHGFEAAAAVSNGLPELDGRELLVSYSPLADYYCRSAACNSERVVLGPR